MNDDYPPDSPPYRLSDEAREAHDRLKPRPLGYGHAAHVWVGDRGVATGGTISPPRTTRRDVALVIAGGIAAGLGGIVGLALALVAGGTR